MSPTGSAVQFTSFSDKISTAAYGTRAMAVDALTSATSLITRYQILTNSFSYFAFFRTFFYLTLKFMIIAAVTPSRKVP